MKKQLYQWFIIFTGNEKKYLKITTFVSKNLGHCVSKKFFIEKTLFCLTKQLCQRNKTRSLKNVLMNIISINNKQCQKLHTETKKQLRVCWKKIGSMYQQCLNLNRFDFLSSNDSHSKAKNTNIK